MESLLGDIPEVHHPPCDQRCLLYLGMGYRQPANASKRLPLSGFGAAIMRNGECKGGSRAIVG